VFGLDVGLRLVRAGDGRVVGLLEAFDGREGVLGGPERLEERRMTLPVVEGQNGTSSISS